MCVSGCLPACVYVHLTVRGESSRDHHPRHLLAGRTLRIHLGPDHIATLTTSCDLALALDVQGKNKAAVALYRWFCFLVL